MVSPGVLSFFPVNCELYNLMHSFNIITFYILFYNNGFRQVWKEIFITIVFLYLHIHFIKVKKGHNTFDTSILHCLSIFILKGNKLFCTLASASPPSSFFYVKGKDIYLFKSLIRLCRLLKHRNMCSYDITGLHIWW